MEHKIKIIVIHGPNLNLLGKRDASKYGSVTMEEINRKLSNLSSQLEIEVDCFQSNHEGSIIDYLQNDHSRSSHGVLVNPGALIRYAYSFRQALVDLNKPVMEVHMSNIDKTGVNKSINVLDDVRFDRVTGLKEESYYVGFKRLVEHLKK
ncbi:MAG: type II 3-dehydroquinate dehydratase [Candidatus Electrothrix sp. AW3_4]|nr:type II 3-dehydroquinate dehydratase [Candidatus Electrothrix gigas]